MPIGEIRGDRPVGHRPRGEPASRSGTDGGWPRGVRPLTPTRRGVGGRSGPCPGRRRGRPHSGRRLPGPARQSSQTPRRRLQAMRTSPRSSPADSSARGASTHASAGMFRSRIGVSGRSAVWTGVSTKGRWSAGSAPGWSFTNPGRPTRRGSAVRRRSWWRHRGRGTPECRGPAGRRDVGRWIQ